MNDQTQQYQQIIAKCWADEAFKQQLIADPVGTLKKEGIDIPDGITIHAVENTDTVFHLVIPPRPDDLSDDELDGAAGGETIAKCNLARWGATWGNCI